MARIVPTITWDGECAFNTTREIESSITVNPMAKGYSNPASHRATIGPPKPIICMDIFQNIVIRQTIAVFNA